LTVSTLHGRAAFDQDSLRTSPARETITAFTETYYSTVFDSSACAASADIIGYEPTGPGTHPVFIYTVGSFATYNGLDAVTAIEEMARRGFIAISPKYHNLLNRNCTTLANKAKCLYSPTLPGSALSKACGRPNADCDKGVVIGGMSQGAQVGILAKNYEPRVRAVWGMGASNYSVTPLDTCLYSGSRVLPADRLRTVDGQHDNFAPDQSQQELMSGLVCPQGTRSCFRENGSGWYRVQDSEVQSRNAGHVFFTTGFLKGVFDPGWTPPADNEWSLAKSLDWLRSFVALQLVRSGS
jgi:hypothetical protein